MAQNISEQIKENNSNILDSEIKQVKISIIKQIVQTLIKKNYMVEENTIIYIQKELNNILKNTKNIEEKAIISLISNELLYPKKIENNNNINTNVEVLLSYSKKSKKADVPSFVRYFKNRYEGIKKILETRPELTGSTSISRIRAKTEKELVSFIGMIVEKSETKNGNLILTVEDPSGTIKVLLSKDKKDLTEVGVDLVNDDIIGIKGTCSGDIVFANSVLLPEIPQTKEYKKCNNEVYACFLSDIHVGSKQFLKDNFEKFLKWIRGETGDEAQKKIASEIKYIFIVGDLVDGIGIYPGQDKDLEIKDIFEQYKLCFNYLDKIPKDKKIVITLGNHDAERLAEPQPALALKYRNGADFSNFIFVSNPSLVRIHKSEDFEGFLCLLYHGYSFDYYVANVNSIRNNGGYDRADLIMKFLLQRRHVAPSYTSTLYYMDTEEDPLIIKELPDFFATGHIHKTAVSNYKNITMISGSTWQDKTAFQEKLGHHPEPCRVPIVNLNTRDVKIIKF